MFTDAYRAFEIYLPAVLPRLTEEADALTTSIHITMTSSKPTLLLIHGAFGTPTAWDKLVPFLERAGYNIVRATYPSANPEIPSEAAAKNDIEHVRKEFLLPLIEQEHKDVIIAVHSFGGIVGGGAAVGLSKGDRLAQSLKGGVLGLIYIAGVCKPMREGHRACFRLFP